MKDVFKILIALSIGCSFVTAQDDSLSLSRCIRAVRQNAALKPQIDIMADIASLRILNDKVTNLPSVSAYGKAWYQSDATSIQISQTQGIEVDPFQYNFGVEADQKLYDGGIAKRSMELEAATREAETGRIETQLYQLNLQAVQYFFGSLLFYRNQEVILLKKETLEKRVADMQSAYNNGVIPRNELEKMKTEVLSTQQQIMEIEKLRLQSLSNLGVLTGLTLGPETQLFVPDSFYYLGSSERPELQYYKAETERLQSLIALKSRQNMPKLYAYGQVGYSYPGLNFFDNNPASYYMVGARLSWPIFDWRQTHRETQVIQKQQDIVATNRNDFQQKMNQSIAQEKIEQEKLNELIVIDRQVIEQRNAIAEGSASALKNGVITSSAYLEDLNAEIGARLELETHSIQLQNSLVRLSLLNGINTQNLY
jgi:outer membrane protein TolC